MAYVPQEAWVLNASVVENVCFRQKLDPSWLERVLEACALWPDVGSFPAGVHTQIGEQVRGLRGRHYCWGHLLPRAVGKVVRGIGETGGQGRGGEKGSV